MKHQLLLIWTWFVMLITSWMPDHPITMRIRGRLLSFGMASCGKDFQVARMTTIKCLENLSAGDHVFIANGAWIMATAPIYLESEVMLGPYTVLVSGNHTRQGGSYRFGKAEHGPIRIGRGTWLGAHATILPGVTVGSGSLIAAGAVVSRNISHDVIAGGVPARVIGNAADVEQSENHSDAAKDIILPVRTRLS